MNKNPQIKTRGACDLCIHWVPGHHDFEPNEKADELAKDATRGESSLQADLLKSLQKPIPMSIAALCQEARARFQCMWARRWKRSPHYIQLGSIHKIMLSKKWLKLVKPLDCKQASLIMQLYTNHIGLNKHLHHIHHADSLKHTNCTENADETIHHCLFKCPSYRRSEEHTSELQSPC